MLSDTKHTVKTSIALCLKGKVIETHTEETTVFFRELSKEIITWHISTGEPFDKAGGYGIQGHGGVLVKKIKGCFL